MRLKSDFIVAFIHTVDTKSSFQKRIFKATFGEAEVPHAGPMIDVEDDPIFFGFDHSIDAVEFVISRFENLFADFRKGAFVNRAFQREGESVFQRLHRDLPHL